MFLINEWRKRYEVSMKGRDAKDGDELRVRPLDYIRLKVYGRRQGAGYRRLKESCGDRFMEVFGIFCKFLEISGDQHRDYRGSLLNENDEEATIDDLAFIIGATSEQVEFAAGKLCECKWLVQQNHEKKQQKQLKISKREVEVEVEVKGPEISGNVRKLDNNDVISLVKTWNKLPLPQEKLCKESELMAIERVVYELASDTQEPIHHGMILEAIANYKKALKLKNSQAGKHKLYNWLVRGHVKKYVDYAFDLDNYDSEKFSSRKGESAKDVAARLKAKGDL